MEQIKNKDDFSVAYNKLLDNHNYRGLVDLLSSTNFNDDKTRRTARNLISKFQEQADIEDKLLEGADEKTRRSYNFITSGPSKSDYTNEDGSINEDSTSYRFMQAWNALANENNMINIQFKTEEQYNKFISQFGGNRKNIQQNGIELNNNYSISFPTDVKNKIDIYNAIKNSGIYDYFTNLIVSSAYSEPGILKQQRGSIYSLGNKERNFYENFTAMNKAVNEANDDYNKLLENTKPYLSEMIVTGYMGEDDKKLQQYLSNGLLDLQTFKEMRSILEEKYNRILQTKDLTQFDVWSMDEDNKGSKVLQKLDNNILKSSLDLEINEALSDDRLHFSHATNGIDIGTMIIIDPKKDNKGNIVGNSKPRRFFVKDLFRSQAENALRDDSQTAAQMQYAKHQTYGHIYRTSNGGTITDWNQNFDTAVYTDKNGTKEILGKAELLNILDDDIIAKRMTDYYSLANEVDKNGNGYTPEYYKVYGSNGFNLADLYNNIIAKCIAAMSQKYAGQNESYIKYKATELAGSILKSLGVDFEGDLDSGETISATTKYFNNKGIKLD